MTRWHHHTVIVLALLLLQVVVAPAALAAYGQPGLEVDASCIVTRVIDGDTFSCILSEVYSTGLEGLRPGMEARVRLADINAPELRPEPEPGAVKATSMLSSLLQNETVYLDIDDMYVFDRYGRIVAVALVPYNGTHLVNVNLLLVSRGLAEVWEHDNEWVISET
ncbi:MAG: thermonuclease family protein, partial [Desulfurococcales archaeon]|nr:thermonuclease family protein [Desulfurococcales archaeon]